MSKSDLTIIRARLSNWGVIYSDKRAQGTSSLYLVTKQGVEEEPKEKNPWVNSLDTNDAKIVDAAVLKLSAEDRRLLIDSYCRHYSIKRIARIRRQFCKTIRRNIDEAETRLSYLLDKSQFDEYDSGKI